MSDTLKSFLGFLVAFLIYSAGDAALGAGDVSLVHGIIEAVLLALIATAVVVLIQRFRSRKQQA